MWTKISKAKAVLSDSPDADGLLGDLVAWSMGDVKIPREAVRHVLATHGLGSYAKDGDSRSALYRAARGDGVRRGRGIVVRPMATKKDTAAAVGVYRRCANSGEVGDDFVGGARVRIENDRAVARELEGQDPFLVDPVCADVAARIAARANELIDFVTNIELSGVLCDIGRSLHWVPFRSAGGTWFVRSKNCQVFRSLLESFAGVEAGFSPIIQPLFSSELSEKNVEAAVTNSIESELQKLADDFQAVVSGESNMRSSTVTKRLDEIRDVLDRLELYRDLMSETAERLSGRADQLWKSYKDLTDGVAVPLATTAAPATTAPATAVPKPKVAQDDLQLFVI